MKKTAKFESVKEAKFRTLENEELKSLTGGLVMDSSLNTITIYSDNTSKDDGKDAWADE
jgi:hypothetical protein